MQRALEGLEQHYFRALGVRYPLVVFVDEATAPVLYDKLGSYTTAPLVPAVIPQEALSWPMSSYSCINGTYCQSGADVESASHRGNFSGIQYWSARYLRISRYSAGPLFLHPALDRCGAFIKIDTDTFLSAPIDRDPLRELRREGAHLAWWQIHVQGQRQKGYMEAATTFVERRGLRVRNPMFHASGNFERKAKELGIPLEQVPEAKEAASVIYGCFFGGDVRFFREPLYQSFFAYMDELNGFADRGWSNQFFLGTAAASFVYASQVRRLYVSASHQQSHITVSNWSVTEFLLGASSSVIR